VSTSRRSYQAPSDCRPVWHAYTRGHYRPHLSNAASAAAGRSPWRLLCLHCSGAGLASLAALVAGSIDLGAIHRLVTEDSRDDSDSTHGTDSPDVGAASAERRRVLVIVLFVAGSLALALVLAVIYSMPSAG
jgi:hypothetical protein